MFGSARVTFEIRSPSFGAVDATSMVRTLNWEKTFYVIFLKFLPVASVLPRGLRIRTLMLLIDGESACLFGTGQTHRLVSFSFCGVWTI